MSPFSLGPNTSKTRPFGDHLTKLSFHLNIQYPDTPRRSYTPYLRWVPPTGWGRRVESVLPVEVGKRAGLRGERGGCAPPPAASPKECGRARREARAGAGDPDGRERGCWAVVEHGGGRWWKKGSFGWLHRSMYGHIFHFHDNESLGIQVPSQVR